MISEVECASKAIYTLLRALLAGQTRLTLTIQRYYRCNDTADSAQRKTSSLARDATSSSTSCLNSFISTLGTYIIPTVVSMSSMESPEREKSAPQPEEPVNSIEDDGAITEDQWQGMGDMLMAIYDYREQE